MTNLATFNSSFYSNHSSSLNQMYFFKDIRHVPAPGLVVSRSLRGSLLTASGYAFTDALLNNGYAIGFNVTVVARQFNGL